MIESLNQEWEKINQEQTNNQINSMPDRIVKWVYEDEESIKCVYFCKKNYFYNKNSHFIKSIYK